MELDVKVFDAIFKGMTNPRQLKEEFNLSKEELDCFLDKYHLNQQFALKDLRWKLHQAIDYSVKNVDDVDDLYVLVIETVKYFNSKYEGVQLTDDIVRQLLLKQFKSATERRAYIELCEGELTPYNLYMQNDPALFIHYLVKAAVASNIAQLFSRFPDKIITTLRFIAATFYDNAEKLIEKEFEKLELLRANVRTKKVEVDTRSMQMRRKLLTVDSVPYSYGYERLFTTIAKQHADEIDTLRISRFFESFTEEGRKAMALRREKSLKRREEERVAKEQQEAALQEPSVEAVVAHTPQNVTPELPMLAVAELEERYKLADEAIRNLELELQEKQQELVKVKQATTEMIFKKLGNAQSNYLLSDLYRISTGESALSANMLADQLMNFFDILGDNFQVEVFGNGYRVGDTFTIQREELASTYQALNGMTVDAPQLTVKLVQYGWSLAGKKIVQPLVKIIEQVEVM